MQDARPGDQGTDTVKAETPDEDRLEAVVAQDPVGMAERSQRVGAEICCLETGRASTGDAQSVLKVLVERVEKAV